MKFGTLGKGALKYLIPGFLAFIMVMSIFGFIIGNLGNSEDSNDVVEWKENVFRKSTRGWKVNFQNQELEFFYNPKEIQDVSLSFPVQVLTAGEKIYLSSDLRENLDEARLDFYYNLKIFYPNLFFACTVDSEDCKDLPIKDCDDANDGVKVIVLKKGENNIEFNEDCLVLSGDKEHLVKVVDGIIYELYGLR